MNGRGLEPEQVIEVTIGLWSREVPLGQRPPALAADIMRALTEAGYSIAAESVCCPSEVCGKDEHDPT